MSSEKFKTRIFPVLFMFVITFVFISVTTVIYTITKDKIKFNATIRFKRAVLYSADISTPEEPDKIEEIYVERVEEIKDEDGNIKYFNVYADDLETVNANVVIKTGAGLWGEITMAVAFDSETKSIKGVEVIDQNETPGLGGRISESWFKEQFRGKISPLTKVAEGEPAGNDQFQAVTGATYTTNAVMDIVNLSSEEIPEIIRNYK
ncbi:MAG TPA: FMN-binding protein [Spirochaetes bacterium]|nr:FMN-binding protein [Spirochaetota bacterium]